MDLQPSGCPLLIPRPSTEPATLEVVPTSRPNQLCWSELPSSPPFHARAKRVELVPAVSCFAFNTVISAHLPCPAVPGDRLQGTADRTGVSTHHHPPVSLFPPGSQHRGLRSIGCRRRTRKCRHSVTMPRTPGSTPPPPSPYQCPVSPCVHHSILSLARRDRGPRLRFLSRRSTQQELYISPSPHRRPSDLGSCHSLTRPRLPDLDNPHHRARAWTARLQHRPRTAHLDSDHRSNGRPSQAHRHRP